MIPIELTIEGLYSYQKRQTIDFSKLTSAGLLVSLALWVVVNLQF